MILKKLLKEEFRDLFVAKYSDGDNIRENEMSREKRAYVTHA
jgi:hypothetical protein